MHNSVGLNSSSSDFPIFAGFSSTVVVVVVVLEERLGGEQKTLQPQLLGRVAGSPAGEETGMTKRRSLGPPLPRFLVFPEFGCWPLVVVWASLPP